jgi:D-alanine-D-alanine ligase
MMKTSDKIRVAVLFGGRSSEHEVSLQSAANVIRFLDQTRFDIVPIGIDKQGNWQMGHDVFANSLLHKNVQQLDHHQHAWFTPEWVGTPPKAKTELMTKNPPEKIFDVVFPVVHGALCEDGTLQGLLELADLPYVGCGVLSSAIGMDKDISKRLALSAGVNVAAYVSFKRDHWLHAPADILQQVTDKLQYPVFVKPSNAGSSIGITKVKTPDQLTAAINEALRFDNKIVIEQGLDILELEVAVLESLTPDAEPIVSVVGEVKTKHDFYSYEAKYLDEDGAELLIPTLLPDHVKHEAQTVAKKIFQAFECEGMARVDLFFDKTSQQIYFNEINTIPGFTQISMYPKLMDASGISYPNLLTHLIELAMKRHGNKNLLVRHHVG